MGVARETELKNTGMTRREALQTVGVMAAAVATAGTATSAMAADGAAKTTAVRPENRIEVNHEWGTLKEIDVSLEDAHTKMATNGLVIDRKMIMIATGLDDLAKALRAAGQTVIETPFDDIYFYGGSFRCWHHPLVRES